MPAVALSRVGARVVESGQRLEALPDPRSPQGRIYPLACLVAIAICAFTAVGNDRFTAIGQWIRRASQAGLARLRAPWDPAAGHHRSDVKHTQTNRPMGVDRLMLKKRGTLGLDVEVAQHISDLGTWMPSPGRAGGGTGVRQAGTSGSGRRGLGR
jgi:DDE_Tnp_1-associated